MEIRLNTKLVKSLSDVLFISASEIISATLINRTTWYRIAQSPDIITIQQLLSIANGLHIPVKKFFSLDKACVIGRREDYIAEPYIPCRYDADALREHIDCRTDATWKKAAEVTGITRDNLRNSLLAIRRTPVMRFLSVCRCFDINPFMILVDPNPERQTGKRIKPSESMAMEIAAIRKDFSSLHETIEELTAKYEALLKAYEQLARQVPVNIGTINGSNIGNIGIAADTISAPEDK